MTQELQYGSGETRASDTALSDRHHPGTLTESEVAIVYNAIC